MNADLIIIAILTLSFAYGLFCGLIVQISSVASLAAGMASGTGAFFLLRSLAPGLFHSAFCAPAVVITAFAAACCVVKIVLSRLIRSRFLSFVKGSGDRLLGGLLSLIVGMILVILAASLCAAVEGWWWGGNMSPLWEGTRAARFIKGRGELASMRKLRRIGGFVRSLKDPGARSLLYDQAAYLRLVENPRLRAVIDDGAIGEGLERGEWLSLFWNVKVAELLKDRGFLIDLLETGWENALGDTDSKHAVGSPASGALDHPSLSMVTLKNGSVLKGEIVGENAAEIALRLSIGGGAITTRVAREEIERITPVP